MLEFECVMIPGMSPLPIAAKLIMQLMHAFDKQSRAFQAVSLVKSVHQRNIADAASPLALRELRAQLAQDVAAMGHGVLLLGQSLGQGTAVFEHVGKE